MSEVTVTEPEHLRRMAFAIDKACRRLYLRRLHDFGVNPGGLEDAQYLVVDNSSARQVVRLARLVEGNHRDAQPVEQEREQLTHRPQAADQHIAVDGHTGIAVELIRLASVPMPSISSS